ncbi:CAP domain-containing protein [Mycena galericulata]|nr:CAP domain-containing protein [Mycena galericulata]
MTTVKTVAPTTKISTPTSTPTSTSSSGSGSGSGSSGDSATYVSIHNTERAKYGASPLVWNNTLAAAAQKWANECKGAHSGGTLGPFGENLAWGTGDFTIADGLQAWMNEEPEYSPSNPVDSHWTQMVWKATTNLGCAVAVCDNLFNFATYGATQYYVCEYWPQGNVGGEYAQNVQN